MSELNQQTEQALHQAKADAEALRDRIQTLYRETKYEDLEHAGLGLDIVEHALEEVLEHTGLGGEIAHEPDPAAHRQTAGWLNDVKRIHTEATAFLASHPSEDLETALKALTIATGSLEEVEERYE